MKLGGGVKLLPRCEEGCFSQMGDVLTVLSTSSQGVKTAKGPF